MTYQELSPWTPDSGLQRTPEIQARRRRLRRNRLALSAVDIVLYCLAAAIVFAYLTGH